ncbi:MAG: hypothetical protein ACK5M3_05425 [Dysgonomonas sp.]
MNNNRLIAEFMGGTYLRSKDPFDGHIIESIEFGKGNHPHIQNADYTMTENIAHLRYHCDWPWLMPVIEKICRLKIGDGVKYVNYAYPRTFGMLHEETGKIMVRLNGFQLFQADTLIEAAYLAVINYIENYKNNAYEK